MVLFGQITLKLWRFKNGHFGSRKRANTMLINFVMLIELFLKTNFLKIIFEHFFKIKALSTLWSKVNYFRDLSLLLDQISQDFSSTWSLDLNRGSFYWKNKRFINRSDLDSIPSQFIFLNPESRFEIATQKFSDLNLIILNVLTQNVLKQYFRYSNFWFHGQQEIG